MCFILRTFFIVVNQFPFSFFISHRIDRIMQIKLHYSFWRPLFLYFITRIIAIKVCINNTQHIFVSFCMTFNALVNKKALILFNSYICLIILILLCGNLLHIVGHSHQLIQNMINNNFAVTVEGVENNNCVNI